MFHDFHDFVITENTQKQIAILFPFLKYFSQANGHSLHNCPEKIIEYGFIQLRIYIELDYSALHQTAF